jgi:hypothetical protein
LESIGLISFYFVYVAVVIIGHLIYARWKRQRRLLEPIQVEMENDDVYIDEDIEEFSPESLLRPLLMGMPNSALIPHDSYRSPLTASRRPSSDHFDMHDQVLTRISRSSPNGVPRFSTNSPLSDLSYSGIVRQLIPIHGKWNYLSSWKRFQYLVLLPAVFLFGKSCLIYI